MNDIYPIHRSFWNFCFETSEIYCRYSHPKTYLELFSKFFLKAHPYLETLCSIYLYYQCKKVLTRLKALYTYFFLITWGKYYPRSLSSISRPKEQDNELMKIAIILFLVLTPWRSLSIMKRDGLRAHSHLRGMSFVLGRYQIETWGTWSQNQRLQKLECFLRSLNPKGCPYRSEHVDLCLKLFNSILGPEGKVLLQVASKVVQAQIGTYSPQSHLLSTHPHTHYPLPSYEIWYQ